MSINFIQYSRWILLLILWQYSLPAIALQDEELTKNTAEITSRFSTYEDQLKNPALGEADLLRLTKALTDLESKINSQILSIETDTNKLAEQITSLGEGIAGEPADVKKKRQSLQKEKLSNERWLSQFRLLLLRTREQLTGSKDRLNNLLTARLFHKGPSIIQLTEYVTDNAIELLIYYGDYLVNHNGLSEISLSDYFSLAAVTSAILVFGIWLRFKILKWTSTKQWGDKFVSNFGETFTISTARYLPWFFVTLTPALILDGILSEIEPLPFITIVAYALAGFIFCLYLIRLFLSPCPPAKSFLPIPDKVGRRLGYKFISLALIGFISYIFIMVLYLQKAPHQFLEFWRDGFVLLAVINLMWIANYSKSIPQLSHKSMVRITVVLALFVLLILELLGYRNFISTASRISAVSLFGFIAVIMLHRMSKDFYDGLDSGAQPWHKSLRHKLGLKGKEAVPGLTIVRLITLLMLWGGFLLYMIALLDFSGDIRNYITSLLVQGISLGNLTISPLRILLAIAIFSLLYTLSSWFKTQLERQWLSKTRIERGAKDALITISGYIGVALGLFIALSVAGVTFTNVAIIAGALSVGIGFGLQNIVNNFVSGLILLFERPIKNGDWIVVGSTEGHVKKISIRSTQIQTFDNADIIVPNSELVSSQVTNWMLYDRYGRIRVPVGVAYGSDTEKVREILNEVATAHPLVVKNHPKYKTSIFFLSFGDSSLNFELRCYIQDIDNALTVKSDLNFAIDKAFREHGIEIPFPQRDIHIRNKTDNDNSNSNTSDFPESE